MAGKGWKRLDTDGNGTGCKLQNMPGKIWKKKIMAGKGLKWLGMVANG